jgi:hypothetical protein
MRPRREKSEVGETKNLSFSIRVNRSIYPEYPPQARRVVHPELERSGPAKYDLSEVGVVRFLPKNGNPIRGMDIYLHLKKENRLSSCFNLQDGLTLQKKPNLFRSLFKGKRLVLWGSVIEVGRQFFVKVIHENDLGKVEGDWYSLLEVFNGEYITLVFPE